MTERMRKARRTRRLKALRRGLEAYQDRRSGMKWGEIAEKRGFAYLAGAVQCAKTAAKTLGLEWPVPQTGERR